MTKKSSRVNMRQAPEAVLIELINRANPGRSFRVGDLELSNVRPHEAGEEPDPRARNTDIDVKVVATGQEITLNYDRIDIGEFEVDEDAATEAMRGLDPEDPNIDLLVLQRIAALGGAYIHVDWTQDEPAIDDEHADASGNGISFGAEHLVYQGSISFDAPDVPDDEGDGEGDTGEGSGDGDGLGD